ncbi:nucleoside-diphosphate kinase [Candidatus Uhrbacteria bacterium UHB]|nr:nucleoside-diphosphate kinase [Candidatus Uhrbacteria bacterium UHB]RIL00665.1 MAG: nucleoside-diphosphate kinase [Candidatus Uhrbacteria bacterium]
MNMQKTLVLIKPDGVARGHVGDIISRFERAGLKLVAIKMILPKHEDVDRHYALTDEWMQGVYNKAKSKYAEEGREFPFPNWQSYGQDIKNGLVRFLKSGPIVAMVLEGEQAIPLVRKLVGATEPASALPGTIRGDFSLDTYSLANEQHRSIRNLIHASGTPEEAKTEIGIWFTEEDLQSYEHVLDNALYNPKAFFAGE